MVEDFSFLKSVTTRTPKMTIPSPSMLHLRGGRAAIDRAVYPDLEAFWADVAAAYRQAIAHLAAAGCRYLQLDDVTFAYLCDPRIQQNCRANGDDPQALPRRYAEVINAALRDKPADMVVTIHTCRGNFKSAWVAEGGYDPVVEAMFSTEVDGYFMEFDSARAGGFEPLRVLPPRQEGGAGPGDHESRRARGQGRPEAPHRRSSEVRAARKPVPVTAMRLLQHPPRQRVVDRRSVAQVGACGRGGPRGVELSVGVSQPAGWPYRPDTRFNSICANACSRYGSAPISTVRWNMRRAPSESPVNSNCCPT